MHFLIRRKLERERKVFRWAPFTIFPRDIPPCSNATGTQIHKYTHIHTYIHMYIKVYILVLCCSLQSEPREELRAKSPYSLAISLRVRTQSAHRYIHTHIHICTHMYILVDILVLCSSLQSEPREELRAKSEHRYQGVESLIMCLQTARGSPPDSSPRADQSPSARSALAWRRSPRGSPSYPAQHPGERGNATAPEERRRVESSKSRPGVST